MCQCSTEENNRKSPDSLLVLTEVSFESAGCITVLKDIGGREWSSSESMLSSCGEGRPVVKSVTQKGDKVPS